MENCVWVVSFINLVLRLYKIFGYQIVLWFNTSEFTSFWLSDCIVFEKKFQNSLVGCVITEFYMEVAFVEVAFVEVA